MKDVVIRVHPLSRAVLLSEYGCAEPLKIGQHDFIFPLLTSAPVTDQAYIRRSKIFLTSTIEIAVVDEVANWIFHRPYHVGALLYKLHKDQMCRFAQAAISNGGEAWAAIEQWLFTHNVEEEHYTMDAAYKCWLRWNQSFRKKNRDFFSRMRTKASVKQAKKQPLFVRSKMLLPEPEIEAALSAFLDDVELRLPGTPKRFPTHARAWFYKRLGGLSEREAAGILDMPRASVGYGCRSMANWIETSAPVRHALTATTGLQIP